VLVIAGHIPVKQRNARINDFKHKDNFRVLLISDVGVAGLNLTEASVVVILVCTICAPLANGIAG
jgi:SNF2 family DNA or RNA helicase